MSTCKSQDRYRPAGLCHNVFCQVLLLTSASCVRLDFSNLWEVQELGLGTGIVTKICIGLCWVVAPSGEHKSKGWGWTRQHWTAIPEDILLGFFCGWSRQHPWMYTRAQWNVDGLILSALHVGAAGTWSGGSKDGGYWWSCQVGCNSYWFIGAVLWCPGFGKTIESSCYMGSWRWKLGNCNHHHVERVMDWTRPKLAVAQRNHVWDQLRWHFLGNPPPEPLKIPAKGKNCRVGLLTLHCIYLYWDS